MGLCISKPTMLVRDSEGYLVEITPMKLTRAEKREIKELEQHMKQQMRQHLGKPGSKGTAQRTR